MKLILGPLIGHVNNNSAKIWIFWNHIDCEEKSPKCIVFKDKKQNEMLKEFQFDTVSSSPHLSKGIRGIAAVAEISIQEDLQEIYFKIEFDKNTNEPDRLYSVCLPPEHSQQIEKLSFALISCHHPYFNEKKDRRIIGGMWDFLGSKMGEHNCSFLIQAGDQLYCDHDRFNAWDKSLKEEKKEDCLWFYREAYLKSWDFNSVNNVLSAFPQYMIWDDHEICNSWGSKEDHYQDDNHLKTFEVAKQAYLEFQQCHNPEPMRKNMWHYAFYYGPAAFLFLDLRGHRNINLFSEKSGEGNYPLVGEEQWEDIRNWLESDNTRRSQILFIVSSVPIFHLSRRFGSLAVLKGDIADQWSTKHNKKERRILLKLLLEWSGSENRPVFILGGDVHVGTVAEMEEMETGKQLYQITSSPITNKPSWFLDLFLAIFSKKFNFHLEENKKSKAKGKITKRFRKRNFAIIEVNFQKKNEVKLYVYKEKKDNPKHITFD